MDRLLYTSASAMRGAMARQTTIANNLANVGTAGFRADMASAGPLWLNGQGVASRVLSTESAVAADMHAGTVTATGRPLDVALDRDAMLAVQSAGGEEGYTRRGDLALNDSGLLTTGDGLPVLGDGGPITLPPADRIEIDRSGALWIAPAGSDPTAPLQKIEQLKLVSPAGSQVSKGVDGLFRVAGGGTLPSDPEAKLRSGSLEGSNVNASQALIDMIQASRDWETQIKMISQLKEIDTDTASLMRVD